MRSSSLDRFELSGALAVVIGATDGIGAAIAEALAGAGAGVVITARDAARLERTRRKVQAAGGEVHTATVDVRRPESIQALGEAVLDRHGPPTILVNSAGISGTKPAFEITVEDWDAIHETQLRGVFLACQTFGRPMAERGYGKIINLSSTWAVTVHHGRSAYSAAKAGLSHLTAALAAEWAPHGIRVNAIAPTATRTPAAQGRMDAQPGREDQLRSMIPLGRIAEPEDVQGAAVFLASQASDFVTGHTLFVDGGFRFAR